MERHMPNLAVVMLRSCLWPFQVVCNTIIVQVCCVAVVVNTLIESTVSFALLFHVIEVQCDLF